MDSTLHAPSYSMYVEGRQHWNGGQYKMLYKEILTGCKLIRLMI